MLTKQALTLSLVVAVAVTVAVVVILLRPSPGVEGRAALESAEARVKPVDLLPIDRSDERGRSVFSVRFDPEEHGGHRQSWDAEQGPNGLMYIANSDGVLEYDGSAWRLIPVPNFRTRAVAVGGDGELYVGGEGTLGVLEPDSTGQMRYREIAGSEDLADAAVWTAVPTARGVLFQMFDQLIAVEKSRVVDVQRAPADRRFHKAWSAAGVAYVRLEGTGLLEYEDGRLAPVNGGQHVADTPVRALYDLDGTAGGTLLIITDSEFYHLRPGSGSFSSVPSKASDTLRQTRAYHGCSVGLPEDGAFAVTTTGGGVIVVSATGGVIETIAEGAGLTSDDLILGCTTDDQGGLWLALSTGIVRVDAVAPLTTFDADQGLKGAVYSVVRYQGRLYAATDQGVYRLKPSAGDVPAVFEPVVASDEEIVQAWGFLKKDSGLLVAGTGGVFAIDGLVAKPLLSETAFALASASSDISAVIYVGLRSGLATLSFVDGAWRVAARTPGIDGEVRSVKPIAGGAWVTEAGGRLYRIREDGGVLATYAQNDGVPEGLASVLSIHDSLSVLTGSGPYRFGVDPLRFTPMRSLSAAIEGVVGSLSDGYVLRTDPSGRVWIAGREQMRAVIADGGGWRGVTPPALHGIGGVMDILDDEGTLWVSTASGLLRLSGSGYGRYAAIPSARVNAAEADRDIPITDRSATVPYGQTVRFRFAATAFQDPARTLYSTQLVGHDEEPSAWRDERFREYTNLSPGTYVFRVDALTAQGTRARPAVVTVTVPAPWYLSVWAAAFMALFAGIAVAAIAWSASRHHRLRADGERMRADELDRLNAQLRHADELKDSMLANTSHELRTPLTAILGFSEILTDHEDDDVQELAGHMLSAGNRLLHTVNDLLDVARLRSGKVDLSPTEVDAASIARRVVVELGPLASQKGLALAVVPARLSVVATLDPDAFARVVTNLVSNGVKFTDRGSVTVSLDAGEGEVHLQVTDTGRGIDAEFLPRLFQTFEQESTGYGRSAEGSGLGMAITGQLVELMGGTIAVESELGRGTTFRVRIPAEARSASPSDHRGSSVDAASVS